MGHERANVEAKLELDADADSVVGAITGADGVTRRFSGWMELANVIEAWRTRATTRDRALAWTAGRVHTPGPSGDGDERMHDDGYFDERVAETYDDPGSPEFDPELLERTSEVLASQAGGGAALEFAIGTGRVALRLRAHGIEVHGIELSRAMVSQLRAKPGGDEIPVTIGDMCSTRAAGTFTLVYLVFNTIMNVTTQQGQVDVFRNAAAHLEPGGRFLIETMVPELHRLPAGGNVVPFHVSDARLGFDEYDVVNQGMVSHHVHLAGDRAERFSVPFRYVWPSELDLMAQLAGMRSLERWSDWDRAPFTRESSSHVSVWEKLG